MTNILLLCSRFIYVQFCLHAVMQAAFNQWTESCKSEQPIMKTDFHSLSRVIVHVTAMLKRSP
jgi:hypothetical protein